MTDSAPIGLLHLLLAGYWLGADLGVYLIASAVADGSRPQAVRVFAARLMLLLDMVPRSCLVLTLASGLHLSAGFLLPELRPWLWALWLAALAWLALVWAIFLRQHRASAPAVGLAAIDAGIRLALIALCLGLAYRSLGAGLSWLAGKLALLGLILALGLLIRWQLRGFAALFARALQGGDAESERRLRRLIDQVRVPVWGIWLAVLAAALLGHLKPA
ncbi:MAG: hypothetical protein RML12_10880 [Xanthomonadales bacterium]|nr:hypothetical protein [Xanthomonadales bacterium]